LLERAGDLSVVDGRRIRSQRSRSAVARALLDLVRETRQMPTMDAVAEAAGVGKGTVLLEDFARADCIFIFGQNPGTNLPRMLGELRAKRP
jgi:anaerobic selenocysteine-containing dehydrogenase